MEPNDNTGNTAEQDLQQGVTQQADEARVNEAGTQTAEEIANQEAEAAKAAEAAATAAKEAAKQANIDRRINELNRKRGEEISRERARADAAERELASLRQPNPSAQTPAAYKPEDIDRIANERAEKLVSKREFDAKCATLVDNGNKEYGAGFDTALKQLGSLQAIVDEKGEFTDFAKAIVDSDSPHTLMKHLGDNPDEAARILNLSPTQQAREIGRLEARLSTQPVTPPPVSKAPTPPSHVGSRNASSTAPSDKDDMSTWMAKREAQLAGK